jgi:hypothetical protein
MSDLSTCPLPKPGIMGAALSRRVKGVAVPKPNIVRPDAAAVLQRLKNTR